MLNIAIHIQILAVAILVIEALYIYFQKPSVMQSQLLLIVLSTLLMIVGYLVEIQAENVSASMAGVAFAYIGKPSALLFSLLFIAEYCGRPISRKWVGVLVLYHALFPVLVFTNDLHHLYYSSVAFNGDAPVSPLILGHGALYYLYAITICAHFVADLVLTITEYKACTTRKAKRQVLYLFGMIFSSIAGYVIYLTGWTNGYDTTMIGAFCGVILLSVLFLRYNFFDSLTIAKDCALDKAANGLLVLDNNGKLVYSNAMVDKLLESGFEVSDLRKLPFGNALLHRGDNVYETKKSLVINRDRIFGNTVELTNITDRFYYSAKLEQEVEKRTKEIRRIQRSVIVSFAGIVEAKDSNTGVHIKNVSTYVELIAKELKENNQYTDEIDEEFITCLSDVAPLHDIGKLSVPDAVLLKSGELTEEERSLMKTHTTQGLLSLRSALRAWSRKSMSIWPARLLCIITKNGMDRDIRKDWLGRRFPFPLVFLR